MIRQITNDDIVSCIELGRQYHAESEYRDLEYSTSKCFSLGQEIITDPNQLWIVSETGSTITGMLGGVIAQPFFSNDWVASDHLVYVSPEYRGGFVFARLVRFFCTWAKIRKVRLILLQKITGGSVDYYTRLGFSKVGESFVRRI